MAEIISISEFSSLNFRTDWKLPFQHQVDYIQKFLPADSIQIQYMLADEAVNVYQKNKETGKITRLTPSVHEQAPGEKYYTVTVNNTLVDKDTFFTLYFARGENAEPIIASEYMVCTELPGTVLLKYTNRKNDQGAVFDGIGRFYFRIEGVFLPQENTFENESEDFRDQRYTLKLLSDFTYEKKTLTLGGGFGVPNWVARKINLIFSLSSVLVDGQSMARSEGSAVKINLLHNDYPLYVYKIELEDSFEDEPYEGIELSDFTRAADEKKKIIRKSSPDDIRVYTELPDTFDSENSRMIRELEFIEELSENYTIEIDDNTSKSSTKASLASVIKLFATHFLAKDKDDKTLGVVTFLKGLNVGGSGTGDHSAAIDENGNAGFRNVTAEQLSSYDFNSGPLGSGYRIKDGDAEFQNLTIRGQFSVNEFLIQQVRAVGGKLLVSPASIKIGGVEETPSGYKCSFNTDGGSIVNPFIVNDQGFHQVFDSTKMSRYWRLITEVGSDYFVMSKTDCESGSGIPKVDDEIILLGNRTNQARQSAIIISAYDNDSPYTAYYSGINSFSLAGKEVMREGNLNGVVDSAMGQLEGFGLYAKNAYIRGQLWFSSGKDAETAVNDVDQKVDGQAQDIQDAQSAANEADRKAQEAQNYIDNALREELDQLHVQADGLVERWDGDYIPTLSNFPVNQWTTEEEKQRHIDDTFTKNSGSEEYLGNSWKWSKVNGTWQWVLIADTALSAALLQSAEAKDIAKEKTRNFVVTPYPPYEVGDVWTQGPTGDMMRCITSRLSGLYVASDWTKASKYTDDTAANEAKARLTAMSDDGIISKEEKASLRNDKAQIDKEYAKYQSDATKYGVSVTALQAAYNALVAFLNNTVKISQDTDFTFSGLAQQAQYNQLFADYYAARTDFANIIADKISRDSIDNLQPGDTNLLDGSNKGWENSNYLIATISLGDYKPKEGEECTIVMKGKLGEGKSAFGIYNSGGSISPVGIYSSNFNSDGIARKTFKWTLSDPPVSNIYINIYVLPDSAVVESEIEWVKLVSGNKTSLLWTPSLNDQKKDIQNAVDGIVVGGANLADNTQFWNDADGWSWWNDPVHTVNNGVLTVTHTNDTNSIIAICPPLEMTAGEEYTLSAEIRSDNTTTLTYNHVIGSYWGGNNQHIGNIGTTSEWQKYKITFKAEYTQKSGVGFGFSKSGSFQVRKFKLEKGNKATDYSLSENDQKQIASEEAGKVVDNTHIGSQNLISRKMMLAWNNVNPSIVKWGQDTDGVYMSIRHDLLYQYIAGESIRNDIFAGAIKFKNNTQYVFSVEWKVSANNVRPGMYFRFYYTDGSSRDILLSGSQTTKIRVDYITDPDKTISKISSGYGESVIRSLIYNISLIEGNKPLQGFPVAEEDQTGASNVNYLDNGNFTFEKEGYEPNQDVTLNLVNKVLQVRSSQTTSTPGLKMPTMTLKAGVYTLNVKLKGVNADELLLYLYTKDLATRICEIYRSITPNLSVYNITIVVPEDGQYKILPLWGAPNTSAYPAGFDLEWATFTPGMIGSTAFFPSQNDIDKNVDQEANKGKLFLRGTGFNRESDRVLILNNDTVNRVASRSGRGLNLITIRRDTLDIVDNILYDTFTQAGVDALTTKLNALTNSLIVCLTSCDISFYDGAGLNNTNLLAALKRCGSIGSKEIINYRTPYAFVGIPDIGEGMGLEVFTSSAADAPYAEISTQIINGILQGVNASIFTKVVRSKLHGEVVATQDVFKTAYNEQDWNVLGDKIKEFNSTIEQTGRSLTLKVNQIIGDLETAEIVLSDGSVNIVAGKNNIISTINASSEGVRIEANKIEITGQTLFKDSNNNEVAMFKNGKVINVNNGVFSVDNTGKMIATSADITGKITANEGKIGLFSIINGELKSSSMTLTSQNLYYRDDYEGFDFGEAVFGAYISGLDLPVSMYRIYAKNNLVYSPGQTVQGVAKFVRNLNFVSICENDDALVVLGNTKLNGSINLNSTTISLNSLPQRSGSGDWRALVMNLNNRRMYWQ